MQNTVPIAPICTAQVNESGEWEVFEWSAEDILPAKEIESLKKMLDPMTYDQEIRGKFVDFRGSAYHGFVRSACVDDSIRWNKKQPLKLCFDFNVSPGVAVVLQDYNNDNIRVIDEVYIPNNSNTPMIMNILAERYIAHEGQIMLYGGLVLEAMRG